jgi:RNA polymerase sigma-70 factor (ECF subfamily)
VYPHEGVRLQAARRRTPLPTPEALVAEHGPAIWGLCRRLCPEPEDAYQEIWEKALAAMSRFDPDGPATLRTWLVTIAHRHLIDRHRRRQVRGEVVELGEVPVDSGVEAGVDDGRRLARLEGALQRLPEAHRRVVVLHHLHGSPVETIAELEGVPPGTVKSRLHRARARLAELLGGSS